MQVELQWIDGSSYLKSDKEKVPNVWILQAGQLKISVIYNHIHYPNTCIFSCPPFFEQEELGDIAVDQAKDRVITLVKLALEDALSKL